VPQLQLQFAWCMLIFMVAADECERLFLETEKFATMCDYFTNFKVKDPYFSIYNTYITTHRTDC